MKHSKITNEVVDYFDKTGKYHILKKVFKNAARWGDEQEF